MEIKLFILIFSIIFNEELNCIRMFSKQNVAFNINNLKGVKEYDNKL